MRISNYYLFIFLLSTQVVLKAQTEFSLDALGRSVFTNNKLDGDLVAKDSTSDKKGVSGYVLFDLGTNLKYKDLLQANAILRVKSPFGAAFGQPTIFQFRQFQLIGKINRNINYEIGDINVELTPYTVFNANEIFSTYESDIFKNRRNVVEYENFIFGNVWRLQGAQSRAKFDFEKGIKSIKLYGFGTRTNATNNTTNPDRMLAGGRVGIVQSDRFEIGANYTGLLDVTVDRVDVLYKSNVVTGDIKYSLDKDNFGLEAKYEGGISTYNFTQKSLKLDSSFNDYFYDARLMLKIKPAKIKITGGYKEVGPQFYSPAAQTVRLDPSINSGLFPTVGGVQRTQTLYDRTTQENLYNRSINPVFYAFNPVFGNIDPYGAATPNRRGFSFGLASDTSIKFVSATLNYTSQAEIIGEGTPEKRKFTGINGGVNLDIAKLVLSKKLINLTVGGRQETTTRDGSASIDLKTTILDAGLTVETFKKFDLMVGLKTVNAKGNEWLGTRNVMNQLQNFNEVKFDIKQNIYALGARVRFADKSYLIINYNVSNSAFGNSEGSDYAIKQLFLNYTIIL